jgi:methyltransferase-like protein/SAM-dependent methyltransferase
MLTTSGQSGSIMKSDIARNAASYDDLPYASHPFPQTQPARLAALARIFDLPAPAPATARVLELGCASGGNLIPLAARHPRAQFLGVDLSQRQIEEGAQRIERLGLPNIRLRQQSLTDLGPTEGAFDYIICHGVYSWVPAPVRQAILRIARDNLAPTGIAFISYNVLPGWRLRQTLRDALALHIPSQGSLQARVAQARALISFLEQHTPPDSNWGRVFRHEAAQLKSMSDSYIGHEFLEECNEPCSFTEFMQDATSHGLAYLSEADLSSMLPENTNPSAAQLLRGLAGNQLIPLEQHIDIFTGRTFRQTLLIHKERESECVRNLTPAAVDGLHLSARPDFAFAREENGQALFMDGGGARFATAAPAMRRAVEILIERLPGSSSLSDLMTALEAEGAAGDPQTRAMLADGLFKMALANLLSPSIEPTPAAAKLSEKPLACPLLRGDAAAKILSSANLRHERVDFDVVAQTVAPLLDGTNDRDALVGAVAAAAREGAIIFQRAGATVTDAAAIADCAGEHVDRVLAHSLRSACLIA